MGKPSLRLLERATAENIAWLAGCAGAEAVELRKRYRGAGQEIAVLYGPLCELRLIEALASGAGLAVYRAADIRDYEDYQPSALIAGTRAQLTALAENLRDAGDQFAPWLERALDPAGNTRWEIGGGRVLELDHTLLMGVVNVTPDSFYSGSRVAADEAVRRASDMAAAGAEIIDLGGESTRPGAREVPADEEIARVAPVIEAVVHELGTIPVSIDTYKAGVAAAAVDAGAAIINDIGAGLLDEAMLDTVAASGAGYVMMHMRGSPRTMQQDTRYDDLPGEVHRFFASGLERCRAAGIPHGRIVLDPGVGFGKPPEGNYELIGRLREFGCLGCPLLVGASRKSFLALAGQSDAAARLEGSLAACVVAVLAGAKILRVHDVEASRRAVAAAEVFAARTGGY
jgi:dihydropteroate synthase